MLGLYAASCHTFKIKASTEIEQISFGEWKNTWSLISLKPESTLKQCCLWTSINRSITLYQPNSYICSEIYVHMCIHKHTWKYVCKWQS